MKPVFSELKEDGAGLLMNTAFRTGLGTPFFSLRYVTFFSVLKEEHSVLFSSFWQLMRP